MSIPRKEHPRPQFKREQWINLNGKWNFAFDFGLSGQEKNWHENPDAFNEKITVPFCPESELSGIDYTDFIPSVWYHRDFEVPADWSADRILLHFGAVDYECRVWVNGEYAGNHLGGSSSFKLDITKLLKGGENQLVVNALDDTRSGDQPRGKQSEKLHSWGCDYTRTTGIWQTVWLEGVSEHYLESAQVIPDLDNACFSVIPRLSSENKNLTLKAVLQDGEKEVACAEASVLSGSVFKLEVENPRPWSPEDPFLYDLCLELKDGEQIIDSVSSYAGLRKFHIEGNKFFLNNKPIFLRFVLDQGFYPDGIWTASDDNELKADIQRSQAVGFNGARLHQKVFEERFHYWADKLGYLTWAEFADWGMDTSRIEAINNHQREWREVMIRDRNHPSILAWTPLNEQFAGDHIETYRQAVREIYDLTKDLDPTRPVNDASGWTHVKTDIYTVHDYDQNPRSFADRYAKLDPENPEPAFRNITDSDVPYNGQPYVVDEYGGTYWTKEYENEPAESDRREGWGFGKSATEVEDLVGKLTEVLLQNPNIAGYTYTQLTDVEQEVNGIYTYDRELKFDAERLKQIFGAKAAIE